jgi:hypothetical protein
MELKLPRIYTKTDPKERFLKKVNKNTDSGCWLWLGSKRNGGYGHFYDGNKLVATHRFSYELYKGKIENNLLVCHKCDVRNCVNPDHLFLGTHKDNAIDMVNKNRQNNADTSGINNGMVKINEKDVINIRNEYKLGNISAEKLGKKYGISESQTLRIIHKQSWK